MCGIFSLLNNIKYSPEIIKMYFLEGQNRGPESSTLKHLDSHDIWLGFHRLAINGYNDFNENLFQLKRVMVGFEKIDFPHNK